MEKGRREIREQSYIVSCGGYFGTVLTCDTNKSWGKIEGKFLQMWALKGTMCGIPCMHSDSPSRSQQFFQVTAVLPGHRSSSRSPQFFQVASVLPGHRSSSRSQQFFQDTAVLPGHRSSSKSPQFFQVAAVLPGHRSSSMSPQFFQVAARKLMNLGGERLTYCMPQLYDFVFVP